MNFINKILGGTGDEYHEIHVNNSNVDTHINTMIDNDDEEDIDDQNEDEIFNLPNELTNIIIPIKNKHIIFEEQRGKLCITRRIFDLPDQNKITGPIRNIYNQWIENIRKKGFACNDYCGSSISPGILSENVLCYGCRESFGCSHRKIYIWKRNPF